MARKSVIEQGKITIDEILDLYEKFGDIKIVADLLKVSERTLRRHVKPYLKLKVGRKEYSDRFNRIKLKMQDNPECFYFKDFSRIAKYINCSLEEVKGYYYYTRKEIKQFLKRSVKKLMRKGNKELTDVSGRTIRIKDILSYSVQFNKWSLEIYMVAYTTLEESLLFIYKVEDLKKL